jgi:hypothetical protein
MLKSVTIFVALVSFSAGCGNRSQKIQPQTTSTNNSESAKTSNASKSALAALTDPLCPSKNKCPDPSFKLVDSSGKELAALSGKLNEDVQWHAEIDSEAKAGRLKLSMRDIPVWAIISKGDEAGVKVLKGKPNQKTTKSSMTFVVRDMMKCKLNTPEADWDKCLDIDHETAFEKEIKIDFKIE